MESNSTAWRNRKSWGLKWNDDGTVERLPVEPFVLHITEELDPESFETSLIIKPKSANKKKEGK